MSAPKSKAIHVLVVENFCLDQSGGPTEWSTTLVQTEITIRPDRNYHPQNHTSIFKILLLCLIELTQLIHVYKSSFRGRCRPSSTILCAIRTFVGRGLSIYPSLKLLPAWQEKGNISLWFWGNNPKPGIYWLCLNWNYLKLPPCFPFNYLN